MRVQVNGRYLVQRVTGVQRYAREIVARLAQHLEVISPRSQATGMRGHLWEQTVLPWRVGRGVLWSPCATGPLAITSQVVTIHDCAFLDCPECFSPWFARWYQYLVPRLARRTAKILTVSSFSRDRICEAFGVAQEKVIAIPNGVDQQWKPAAEGEIATTVQKLKVAAPYVLYVGSLEPRKNLRRLLSAWQQLGKDKNGAVLLLAGATSYVFRDAGLSNPPEDVRPLGFVSDGDLKALLSGAAAFVFPSLYEGFGLPVLEAMACGAPVVCSSSTALPEVAGDAALLVNPHDPESIADGLRQILFDAGLRTRLCERGFARAARYSWDTTAARVWDALNTAL